MKIIHTGDWHIGKIVHQVHMTEDQRHILKEFVNLIKEEKPDVVVIAGDLYDRSVPPVEAVELLDQVFSEILIDLKTPIMAIAGNHDSADRVGFASKILKDNGLYIAGRLSKDIKPVVIHDVHGPVSFYMLPYADPAVVRDTLELENIKSHEEAFEAVINRIRETMNKDERNVMVAHGFITGGMELETSESERPLSIGGTEFVDAKHFGDFHYTALGHLHGAQKVGSDRVRYSGSLMKYSFSEVRQNKSVTIVKIDGNGEVEIELKSLNPLKDMREIKGRLEDLLNPEVYKDTNVEDYLKVTLIDEGELIDPISKLRTVYPNVMQLFRDNGSRRTEDSRTSAGKDHTKKSKLEMFDDFYTNIRGKEFTEEMKEVLSEVLEQVEKVERGE